jgi:nitrile hydratase
MMNTIHDMGGMDGFGPLVLDQDDACFHDAWERRAFAMTLAMGATKQWNLDQARAARESLPMLRYLQAGYYGIWFEALEKLLQDRGLLQPQANAVARSLNQLAPQDVKQTLLRGAPTEREGGTSPVFKPGDAVMVRAMNPPTHTRCPRYLRGKQGMIDRCHGFHVFPDRHAVSGEEAPQALYTVVFKGRDLWGDDGSADLVSADLWESYLVPLC